MRSLFITAVYLAFFIFGIRAPFVLVLGYVWVDIFTPQYVVYGILNALPVSMIMSGAVILAWLLLKSSPIVKLRPQTVLVFVFGLWMTLTLSWAVVPDPAFQKWDWAIKGVLFSCLVPSFFRSREQLESLLWVILLSGMAHCLPFGAKVVLSGGGYGQALGLVGSNSGYGEGSTLAMFSASLVPIALYLYKHGVIFQGRLIKLILAGCCIAALLTALGTFARTGLVCTAVVAIGLFITSRRKVIFGIVLGVVLAGAVAVMGASWEDRMSTITTAQNEASAMGRVGVWLWTIDYVKEHPLGGSFNVYFINKIELPMEDGTVLVAEGKAFHSIYFEVLGETGFPGLALCALIALVMLRAYWKIARQARGEQLWMSDLSKALIITSFAFFAGGLFIGVAFQSYFYYLVAMSAILQNLFEASAIEVRRKNDANLAEVPAY
ncbi:MAG TPA: putative O-glycosylation ligase, exosortase A system-associated [Rhodocyclaceae bacterium]